MQSALLVGTTAADGTLTVTFSLSRPMRVVNVEWLSGDFADGVDATLKDVGPGYVVGTALSIGDRTILTITDGNVDAWYDISESGDGLVNQQLKLSVTSGGNAKSGGARVYLDEVASVSGSADASAANQATQITSLQLIDDVVLAEDAAHVSGDKGVMLLAVRKDTAIALAGTDGDYIPVIVDANGRLHVVAVSPIRTYTKVTGTTATSGDQTLVAAPSAGFHLVIKDSIIQNESAVDTTAVLKEGASTSVWRAKLLASSFAALALSFAEGEEWRLATATALVLNLSGANSHGYSIRYRIEAD